MKSWTWVCFCVGMTWALSSLGAEKPLDSTSPVARKQKLSENSDREKPAQQNVTATQKGQAIVEIRYLNRIYFKKETIGKFVQSQEGQQFSEKKVEADARRLEHAYISRGFLRARVKVQAAFTPQGAHVDFVIEAGQRATLSKVYIHGNTAADDSELRHVLFSRDWFPLGLFAQRGIFHRPFLDDDKVRILQVYAQKGYLEARVDQISIQADVEQETLDLHLRIHEGRLYHLASVEFIGDVPDVDVETLMQVKEGEPANIPQIQKDVDAALDAWREEGYAFVQAEQSAQVVEQSAGPALALTYHVQKHKKVKTQDIVVHAQGADTYPVKPSVVRKYLRFKVGETYQKSKIDASKKDLMRTGYFSGVEIQAEPIPDTDGARLHVQVLERKTWILGLAPSYQRYEGIIGNLIFADSNFLGTGNAVSLSAVASALRQDVDFWLKIPRVFNTKNGFGLQLYRKQRRYQDFIRRRPIGGRLSLNRQLDDALFVHSGLKIEALSVAPISQPLSGYPLAVFELGPERAPVETTRSSVDIGLIHDRRNNPQIPTSGTYAQADLELIQPIAHSDKLALRFEAAFRFYWSPWFWTTLRSNTDFEMIDSLGTGALPVTEMLYTGNSRRLRGFAPLSVGPVVDVDGPFGPTQVIVGASSRISQNLQLEIPTSRARTFALIGFLDLARGFAGQDEQPDAYEPDLDNLLMGGLYASAGGGVVWQTSVAPIRFMIGAPLTGRSFDKAYDFILEFGSGF